MKIECVQSLAPAEPSEAPSSPAVASVCDPKASRTTTNQPYRKILVTSDVRSTVEAGVIRHAVSSFVRDKVNALVKEACIVRLHWDGVDVHSLFLRGIEPLTPPQIAQLKGQSNYNVVFPNRSQNPIATQSSAPMPPANVFRSAPSVRGRPRLVSPAPAVIRNSRPQLINVPTAASAIPPRPAGQTLVPPVIRAAPVSRNMPLILPKVQPSILRNPPRMEAPLRTEGQQQLMLQLPAEKYHRTSNVNAQHSFVVQPDLSIPPATMRPIETSMQQQGQQRQQPPSRFTQNVFQQPSAAAPMVMVRFNGRVQPAQPGQLIRRTNGRIVRVMEDGSLEEVEVPIVTPKKVEIKSSRDKPISLDSDSEDEASGDQSKDSSSSNVMHQQLRTYSHNTSQSGNMANQRVNLVEDSSNDSVEYLRESVPEFIGIDETANNQPTQRRVERIGMTRAGLRTITGYGRITQLRPRNQLVPVGVNRQRYRTTTGAPRHLTRLPPSKRDQNFEFIMGSNGVIERVPLINDPEILVPEVDMVVEEEELTQEKINSMVEKGREFIDLYTPPPNCQLMFREAEEVDFMDTVIVEEDGEVVLDPELYQTYMQVIYEELLADHRQFKAELRRKKLLQGDPLPEDEIDSDHRNASPSPSAPSPPPASFVAMMSTEIDGPSRSTSSPDSSLESKRSRVKKRNLSPQPDRPVMKVRPLPTSAPHNIALLSKSRKVNPSRPHVFHYVGANGLVKSVLTADQVKTRPCFVIMDKLADQQALAEFTKEDGDGTIHLRQQDGTDLPVDKLFAAKSPGDLYYNHEAGRVDPDRKRGLNWDCLLHPVAGVPGGTRHPVRFRSRTQAPGTKRHKGVSARKTTGNPQPAGVTVNGIVNGDPMESVGPSSALTIETRKKEIVFEASDDDFVDVDKLLSEHDDSWEAGTSDEDWDIKNTRVARQRRRRSKATQKPVQGNLAVEAAEASQPTQQIRAIQTPPLVIL